MSDDLKTNYTKLNKRYQEIKRKLAESNESHHKNIVELTKIATEKDRKIEKLKQQLAITEEALELACKEITGSCEYCSYKTRIECPVEADCLDEKINYFKTKAKEMIKSE